MRKWFFNWIYLCAAFWLSPWFLFKAATTGKYRAGLAQRLGSLPARKTKKPAIWVHAVSVGELLSARPLIERLTHDHPDHEVCLTYTTKTAAEVARKQFTEYWHCYSPVDLSWVVAKFYRVLKPALLIQMELELWPNWLEHAKRNDVPVLVVNGRISDKSFRGYSRVQGVLQKTFDSVTLWGMQENAYSDRAKKLAPNSRVETVGNLKFDSLTFQRDPDKEAEYERIIPTGGKPVIVFGSTHPGEHELITRWAPKLEARIIVAPRHPERLNELRSMLDQESIRWVNRSDLTVDDPAEFKTLVVLDTMGELNSIYSIADVAFVGGSLIPHGGQNMAEPCALGVATVVGPSTGNFRATMKTLLSERGIIQADDAGQAFAEIQRLISEPEIRAHMGQRARECLLASRGALDKYAAMAKELLGAGDVSSNNPTEGAGQ